MKSVVKAIGSGLILAASLFVTSAGSAFAQDWSLNITDVGYDPIPAGGDIVYQVRVDNALSSPAPATTVVFEIPANTTYQGVTGALTNCVAAPGPTGPATVTCDVPALVAHQTIDAQLTVVPNVPGSIQIAGNLGGDRVVQRTTVVNGADLSFELIAPTSARGGELYTFTARIRNQGPNISEASTATISLPPGMSAPLSLPAGCTISGRDITCNLAAIAANNVLNLEFTTQITADSVSTLALAGSVAGNTPRDPRLGNNGGSAGLNVVPGTDVQIGKVRTANNPVMIGDTVTFTLTPRYVGLPPTDAVITDVVPPNYRVDSVASGSGWTCSTAQTVSCTYAGTAGDAASYTQPVVITATALTPTQDLDDPPAFVTNEAVITSSTDNVTTNNSGTDGGASIVEPYVDLRAIKNAPPLALGVVGQTYPWEIGTINLGNAPFYGPLEFVDRVPAGLRVESITEPAGWTCDAVTPVTGPVTITCSTNQYTQANPLAINQRTALLTMQTTVLTEDVLFNELHVGSDNYSYPDRFPGNNDITVGLTTGEGPNIADIGIRKRVTSATSVASGTPVTFEVELTNSGTSESRNVVFEDRLNDLFKANASDTSVTFDASGAPGAICSLSASSAFYTDLRCELAVLPVCVTGSTCPVISFTAVVGDVGLKTNTANIYSTQTPDPAQSNNSSSAGYEVLPRTDVTVAKAASAVNGSSVPAGQPIIYTITASTLPTGLSPAQNVTINDSLPPSMYFVSAVASQGSCSAPTGLVDGVTSAGSVLSCNLNTLNAGTYQTVTLTMLPLSLQVGQDVTNRVSVATSTTETDPLNNTAEITHRIAPPSLDVLVNKSDYPDPVRLDGNTVYTIRVSNPGPSAGFGIELVDTFPTDGLSYVSHSTGSSGFSCAVSGVTAGAAGGTLRCDLDYLPSGADREITVTMQGIARGRFTNSVTVTSAEQAYDSDLENNTAVEATTVYENVDLVVTKAPSSPSATLNEPFNWTIDVLNRNAAGLGIADAVVLSDTLPANMVLTGAPTASSANAICTGAAGGSGFTCQLGVMQRGDLISVTVPVRVIAVTTNPQSFSNTASVTTSSFETAEGNNSDTGTVSITSTSIAGRVFTDLDGSGTVNLSEEHGVNNVLVNLTGTDAYGNTVSGSTRTLADGTYTFGLLPPGTTYSVSYTPPTLTPAYAPQAALPTGAGGGTASGLTAINGITATVAAPAVAKNFTLLPAPQLALAKAGLIASVNPDGTYIVQYDFNIANQGEEAMRNIELRDSLSASFGTLSPDSTPEPGQFYISSYSVAGSYTYNAGFDGSSDTLLMTLDTIAPGTTASVRLRILVNSPFPLPGATISLVNTATVTGETRYSSQNSGDSSNNGTNPIFGTASPTTITRTYTPTIQLTKTATPTLSTPPAVGDLVTYNFVIRNTGNTPLQAVTLTDNTILPGNIVISPAIGTLAAGASTAPGQVTATYRLTQDDLNAGQLVNTASVSANAGTGLNVSDTDSATVTGLADPGLSVVKTVASSTVTNPSLAGQTIRYSFVVTNTGNVTLENLVLSDVLTGIVPDPAGAFTIGTLAPEGEPGDSTTVYATYTITQDDIDAGIVENQASVDGTWGPSGTPIDADSLQVDVPLYKAPSLRVVKLSDSASVPAVPVDGDTITWTVTITNTGNTRLTLTNIDEPMAGATVTAPTPSTLEPLGVATATVSYNLTQTDIDAGGVVNQVTVSSEIPGQPDVVPDQPSGDDATTPNTDLTETPLNREPSLTLVKTLVSTPSNPAVLNEVLNYTFEIRNTGNVTLTNITLDDLLPGAAIDTGDLSWLAALRMVPDATVVVSVPGTYPVTQADIEAGHVTNRAIATGTAPDNRVVDDESGTDVNNDDPTVATLGQNPGIALVKTIATAPAEPMKEGDIVTYSFAVSNTGNVELRDIAITDAVAGVTVQGTRSTPLLPGETDNTSFTATYALTEADIVARNFINTATATGTGNRGGVPVQVSNTDDEELLIGPNPRLAIAKSADATALQAPPQPGDIITYSFVISNTGNLDLTDVTLTDPLPGLTLPVTVVASLPAHQSVTLTGTYAITAGDLTNGLVDNQASVTGDYVDPGTNTPGTLPPVPSNPVQVPLDRVPGISLVKTADATAVQSPARPGDQISYAFTVSNTGNVDLRDVVVADPLPGLTPGSFTIASLPIGATVTVQPAIYALTQADIDAGKVENRAKATGTWGTPADPQQVEDDSVTDAGVDGPTVTTLDVAPAIALVKTVDPAINIAALRAGSQLRWTFEVTNTGNVTLTGVTISESLAGVTVTGGPVTLAPGAVDRTSFTAAYTITQADLDQGFIRNSATVTGTHDDGTNPPVEVTDVSGGTVSDDNPTVTPLTQKPGIALIKTADVTALSDPAKAGDTIRYAFTVTNTGDVTLTNVTVTDALPGITLSGNPIASLAPGAVNSTAITAAYVLTQADIDAGRVENTALVTGSWTDGSTGQPGTVTDTSGTDNGTDTPTVVEIEPVPGLELVKTADASAISVPAVAGEPITYHFAITNTGNVTMTNVVIDDPMPGLVLSGQPIASLAPGETSTAISGIYPITAADIVATEITNTAKAGGEWSKGSVSSHTDSNNSTVEVPLGYPEIAFSITVGELRDLNGDGIMGPGDEVVFRFEVTNTGTVPLNGVDLDYSSLSLLMPGLVCTPITLAVGESAFLECVGTAYRITEDDAARGEIVLTGTAQGTSDAGVVVTDASTAPAVTGLAMGGLTITKLAGVETAMVGDLVPYTIRIANGAEGVPVTTRVVDTLPAGFIYREGSAQLDGVAVTPAISGRTLVIEPVTVNPGQTRVLTMSVLVGSSVRPGAHTNVARLVNPGTGIDIAEEASATVRVLADAVMQCATVLGRVFDDTDQNGHMSKAAEERGLPNVRLVAPNGLAITTDEHGRFNVPCAALPQAIGSNFMLKLDERTLPSGYRLTTENPRVVRLTPGMITRLDFGATMARLVRIDLAANAFTDGGLSPALEAGLKKMVAKISDQATMLRISYVLASGEDAGNAKARLRLVEKTLRNLWRGTGTYKLNIETVIERAGVEQ